MSTHSIPYLGHFPHQENAPLRLPVAPEGTAMSRYELVPDDLELLVSVGWDPVLATYFAQVVHPGIGRPARDVVLLWVGTALRQLPTLPLVERHVTPYLTLAEEVRAQLESVPEITSARVASRTGRDELRVIPDAARLAAFGLTADQVLPALNLIPREGVQMQTGFTLRDGREIPLTVRREGEGRRALDDLRRLRLATPVAVVPMGALADVRRMPPPPTILHKNGRREISVLYTLDPEVQQTGPLCIITSSESRHTPSIT